MTRDDDERRYRAEAKDAEEMSRRALNQHDRERWLQIAQGWLGLVRQRPQSAEEAFDAQAKKEGTGQEDNKSSN